MYFWAVHQTFPDFKSFQSLFCFSKILFGLQTSQKVKFLSSAWYCCSNWPSLSIYNWVQFITSCYFSCTAQSMSKMKESVMSGCSKIFLHQGEPERSRKWRAGLWTSTCPELIQCSDTTQSASDAHRIALSQKRSDLNGIDITGFTPFRSQSRSQMPTGRY